MRTPGSVLLILCFTVGGISAEGDSGSRGSRRQLLLVSLDGFRHDYLTKYSKESTFLTQMASEGVHVKAVQTEFLTKTFPSHWTMVTGRHPESHGIVSNSMFDPEFNDTFSMATTEARWWNDSEPIWVTASRHGGLKTAALAWPGGDVELPGGRPNFSIPYREGSYNGSMTNYQRLETTIDWLVNKEVDLCLLYFSEPDSAAHSHGPDSEQVAAAIKAADSTLRNLIDNLKAKGLNDKVDVIVTSDHGMSQVSSNKVVNFNGSLDKYVARYMDQDPHLSMFANAGMQEQLVDFINNQTRTNNLPIRVFTRDSMPQRLHYSQHRRIPDVLVLPNPGWSVVPRDARVLKGNHGFDNTYEDMKVPLIAFGPSFRRGAVVDGFRQVDIYGLMCHLMKIQPQPNNGSLELLPRMLNLAAMSRSAAAGLAFSASVAMLARLL